MNALIAVIGIIVLGYVWIALYNYASGFEDQFLLGSFAAATLRVPGPKSGSDNG